MKTLPVLEARGLRKDYPGVRALDGVDFTLRRGEIHALMGQNGAGKSTLIKLIAGAEAPDAGTIALEGRAIRPRTPLEAQRLGISTVYQEVNLIPDLSVAENLFLGRAPSRFGLIDWGRMRRRAVEAMERLQVAVDVDRPLRRCSIAVRQMVAIARALEVEARVLVLDEPTSSLDAAEVERLFGLMRRLKARGLAIVFVTHFLDQVYAVSDRITVLRNGKLVGEHEAATLPRLELVEKMIGRRAAAPAARAEAAPRGAPVLQVSGLGRRGAVEPFDLTVHAGEVVGFGGLLGSGRTEAARLLFGADRATSGRTFASPRHALAAGVGFCPEDRKGEGIIPELSVRENIVLALQARQGWLLRIPPALQRDLAETFIRALGIATPDAEKPIGRLSGGNQQKAVLARWLAAGPKLLILDEPTRGIDVGAKAEIEKLVARVRGEGMAVVLISSELEEVARASGRVVVMRDRRKVGELEGAAVTVENLMRAIAGVP